MAINGEFPSTDPLGKILLAEDDERLRTLEILTLTKSGFEVVAVGDGRLAFEAFREQPANWDCVILDLGLPGWDGWRAYTEMQTFRPNCPTIFCTGLVEMAVRDLIEMGGKVRVLLKPYSQQDLIALIREVGGIGTTS